MKAISPTGSPIIGTKEVLYGLGQIDPDSFTRQEGPPFVGNCRLDFQYLGYTELDWDNQKTVTREGQRIFIDENGQEWAEIQITLVEDDQ